MNKGKTEFMIIGSGDQIAKCSTSHLNINNVQVQRSRVIKYLGTHMDEKLSFEDHITAKCRTAAINFQCIKAIWQVLTEEVTETLVLGIVMSHLDCCNATHCDLPNIDISRFQVIQNMHAKLVKGSKNNPVMMRHYTDFTGCQPNRELNSKFWHWCINA